MNDWNDPLEKAEAARDIARQLSEIAARLSERPKPVYDERGHDALLREIKRLKRVERHQRARHEARKKAGRFP